VEYVKEIEAVSRYLRLALDIGISSQRVNQIKKMALQKMQHPARSEILKPFAGG